MKRRGRVLAACALLVAAGPPATAERLAVRTYTTADGLAQDGAIEAIMQDSRGFLWFLTSAGTSRFDGQTFHSYGDADGLSPADWMIETRGGEYWLAPSAGVARYDPSPTAASRFPVFRIGPNRTSNNVFTVADDGSGGLWLGTEDGLYHARRTAHGLAATLVFRPEAPPHTELEGAFPVLHLLRDSRGALWATAHYAGVYRIRPDGGIEHYTARDGVPRLTAGPFLEDHAGRMWLATALGLLSLDPQPQASHPLVLRRVETRFGRPENLMLGLCETPDGHLWMASAQGLLEFDGERLRRYTRSNGLAQDTLWSILPDRDGNLWVGTKSAGVMRISRTGITSFDQSDGVDELPVASLQTLATGELISITRPGGRGFRIYQIAQKGAPHFRLIQPRFPASTQSSGLGYGQILLRDHLGETWIATRDGLARFPYTASIAGLDGLRPSRVYSVRDGLPSNNIGCLFEDSRGDIWIGFQLPSPEGMGRWVRASRRFENLTGVGMPQGQRAMAFAESRSGTLWIGCWGKGGGVTRFHNGSFRMWTAADGLPKGMVGSLYIDPSGRVWGAAQGGGLFRVDDADSERPHIVSLTEKDGLSSNVARCVTGDSSGRIYAGTLRGVDRLDPATGEIRHFSTADGLANSVIDVCAVDRFAQIWFGTEQGLSRLSAAPERAPAIPAARILGVQLAGRGLAISDLGETALQGPSLQANQSHVQISFAAINSSGSIRYRYMLEGADRGWGKPSAQQTVDYPALRPGNYRFVVQAVGAGSRVGSPASFSFLILPPLWQRWWFLLLAALALAGSIYAAWRFRLNQLLEVERVRMRIATDLHDDIGSALSQIGLLSEAARRQPGGTSMPDALARIATVSRETAAAMADIVWTINPQRDSLGDLSVRIRRFASELFSARDIDCVVVTPESDEDLKLGIDTRRQLLLVAKEAMHNVIRHARSTQVSIELKQEHGWVVFRIRDDGTGFDPQASADGHGIASMRSRAEGIGGTLSIASRNGWGTRLEVRIPK